MNDEIDIKIAEKVILYINKFIISGFVSWAKEFKDSDILPEVFFQSVIYSCVSGFKEVNKVSRTEAIKFIRDCIDMYESTFDNTQLPIKTNNTLN